jgi:outer membrane lipoprotein-sorting protein
VPLLSRKRARVNRPAAVCAGLLAGALIALLAAPAIAVTEPPIPVPVPRDAAISGPPFDALVAPGEDGAPVVDRALVLQNISNYFNSIRTMQGQFIQIGPNDERSEGTFYLSRPGKVRFRYQPPVRVEVVADGKSLSVEDKSAGTQDLYPLSKTPLKALLANHIDLTSTEIVGDLREEGDLISVQLSEPTFGDGRLTLIFDKASYELRQWVVTDARGLNTSVALFNVTTGQPIDPRIFRIYITGNAGRP